MDLISRQAAIDELTIEYMARGMLGEKWAVERCIDAIKNLPSAQEWIPVTERLPEESGYYLITSNSGYVYDVEIRFFFFQHERRTKWKEGFGEVVAWMPLPEPYVEVKNDRHFK